jgi:hypothetical protein
VKEVRDSGGTEGGNKGGKKGNKREGRTLHQRMGHMNWTYRMSRSFLGNEMEVKQHSLQEEQCVLRLKFMKWPAIRGLRRSNMCF